LIVEPSLRQAGIPTKAKGIIPRCSGAEIESRAFPGVHTRDLITFSENGEIASRINTDKENERKNQQ